MSDGSLSVVIPAWNAALDLPLAVQSARENLPTGSEIVVSVDGSADSTLAVAHRLADDSGGVVRVVSDPRGRNLGAGATRNAGLASSRGEFLAFLDSDDRFLPGRFALSLPLLRAEPGVDAVFELTRLESEPSDRGDGGPPRLIGQALVGKGDLVDAVSRGHCWHLNAMTLRRSALHTIGMFDPTLRRGQDVEFMLRVVSRLSVRQGRRDVPVAVYRRHPLNRSAAGREGDMLQVICHARRWARKVAGELDARIVTAYLQSVFDRARETRSGGRRAKASRDLLRVAIVFPRLWCSRLFWRILLGHGKL